MAEPITTITTIIAITSSIISVGTGALVGYKSWRDSRKTKSETDNLETQRKKTELEMTNSILATNKADREDMRAELVKIRADFTALEEKYTKLDEAYCSMEHSLNLVTADYKSLRHDYENARDDLKKALSDLNSQKDEVARLTKLSITQKLDMDSLSEKYNALSGEHVLLRSKYDTISKRLDAYKEHIDKQNALIKKYGGTPLELIE